MNTHSQLEAAEKALTSTFAKIDTKVKKNLQRVLRAFRDHKVGPHHFSGVTGYGHDDLGRQVLDRVFAQVMGAEAAAVRVQFVSGTHAIASMLFGILRPGDEMLSVAGPPYDTLGASVELPWTSVVLPYCSHATSLGFHGASVAIVWCFHGVSL